MKKQYQKPLTKAICLRQLQGLLAGSVKSSREGYSGQSEQEWN